MEFRVGSLEVGIDEKTLIISLAVIISVSFLVFVVPRLLKKRGKEKRGIHIVVEDEEELEELTQAFFRHFQNKIDKTKEYVKKCIISDFDLATLTKGSSVVFFVLKTNRYGSSAKRLLKFVKENKNSLKIEKFSLFSLGKVEDRCFVDELEDLLLESGSERVTDTLYGRIKGDYERQFRAWKGNVIRKIVGFGPKKTAPKKKGDEAKRSKKKRRRNDDIEDLENGLLKGPVRESLEKQRYSLVGSHSGVKLCRWVKNMLKGKGCCYKHAAYGLTSYCCLQSSTCVACANKCIFCWRKNTNPVTKEWHWEVDDPKPLVEKFITTQKKLIKELRGLPNMPKEWHEQAMEPKHCALSLIGEPLLYPKVNEFVKELHRRGISTFLVTNGQFPDHLKRLTDITQLYVSINAPNKESLKALSRPIFDDFWERFIASLKILSEKRERTVFRLTLIKGMNMDDIDGYINLVKIGKPGLIEIKGVTFCGNDDVRMSDVPYHYEVREFAEKLMAHGGLNDDYEIAVEHEHTCFMLIAHKKYKVNGEWYTWIDFDKFSHLYNEGKEFCDTDYMKKTPHWSLYGAQEKGMDPNYLLEKKE